MHSLKSEINDGVQGYNFYIIENSDQSKKLRLHKSRYVR